VLIDQTIGTGIVKVLNFIDDHSRVALRSKALDAATSEATWEGFCEASERWGVPIGQLSDNGLTFSGKLRGFEVHFEIQLRSIGVVPKTSRPFHPQTCGKVERFQQTVKKWLRKKPLADDLAELQAQLDAFVDYYNHERPHRGIGRVTPIERWAATPPAINLGTALPAPAHQADLEVDYRGVISLRPFRIHVGVRWAGQRARVHFDETHAAVFIDHNLVRALVLDRTRTYQPSGLPRGPRRQISPHLSEMSRDMSVRHVARHNTGRYTDDRTQNATSRDHQLSVRSAGRPCIGPHRVRPRPSPAVPERGGRRGPRAMRRRPPRPPRSDSGP
jgi:hypothetical protein